MHITILLLAEERPIWMHGAGKTREMPILPESMYAMRKAILRKICHGIGGVSF